MLTPEQEKWVASLSDRPIKIIPYDSRVEGLFEQVKEEIYNLLGQGVKVEHVGATSFGISGQDEIDISIVADKEKFSQYISKLKTVFGAVQSNYPDRARFEVKRDGKKIDLKIIDINHQNYLAGKMFEEYLKNYPDELERYRVLKEESNGKTMREYYRRKIEFINEILIKTKL